LAGTFGYGLGAAPLAWYLALRNLKLHRGVAAALIATVIPISLGGRFYNHYYLQLVPPLALLAAGPLVPIWRRALPLLVAPVLVVQIVHLARNGDYPSQEPRALAAAAWLRQNSAPTDKLVVYGHFTPLYQMAERMPGSRYIHMSTLFGNFDATQLPAGFQPPVSRADEAALIADLEKNRPRYFADTSTANIKGWSRLPMPPDLAAAVNRLYEPVASPAGVTLYRLRASDGSTKSAAHRQVTSPMSATQPNERSAPLWARSSEL
jgi:hypothetical protein